MYIMSSSQTKISSVVFVVEPYGVEKWPLTYYFIQLLQLILQLLLNYATGRPVSNIKNYIRVVQLIR